MRLEIDGARMPIERAQIYGANLLHAGQENVSHGTPAAIAAPIVG